MHCLMLIGNSGMLLDCPYFRHTHPQILQSEMHKLLLLLVKSRKPQKLSYHSYIIPLNTFTGWILLKLIHSLCSRTRGCPLPPCPQIKSVVTQKMDSHLDWFELIPYFGGIWYKPEELCRWIKCKNCLLPPMCGSQVSGIILGLLVWMLLFHWG